MSMVLKPKLFAIVLLLCFGVLAGFSPLLHNHDLDFSEKHEDCASCLWSQSKISCGTHAPCLLFNHIIQKFYFESSQESSRTGLFLISNRGPPFSLWFHYCAPTQVLAPYASTLGNMKQENLRLHHWSLQIKGRNCMSTNLVKVTSLAALVWICAIEAGAHEEGHHFRALCQSS